MLTYPIILIPETLKRLNPPTTPKPLEPVYPILPPKPRPLPPIPQPINLQRLVTHSLMATVSTFVMGSIIKVFNPALAGGLGIFLLLMSLSVIFLRTLGEKQSFSQRQQHYEELQEQYLLKLANYSEKLAQFDQIKLNYSQASQTYQGALREWQQEIKRFRAFLAKILSESQSYGQISQIPPKSYAEKRLNFVLQKYFSPFIQTGIKIQNLDENLGEYYLPDFAYIDQEIKLYIDIEIDEPYHFKTHEITHCLGTEEETKQEDFLLDNNWIIVRFSEEQGVKFPQSCCKTIAEIIYQVTGDNTILSQLESESDLPLFNRWNEEEALTMLQKSYRQSYLK